MIPRVDLINQSPGGVDVSASDVVKFHQSGKSTPPSSSAMAHSHLPVQSLLRFLKQARQAHLSFVSGALSSRAEAPIYVVGNPSADLDSIISAIVYSYFAHNRLPYDCPRPHIPLINLPSVPSGPELYRLRPEFVKAFWLATNDPQAKGDEVWEETPHSTGEILRDHIITVHDFATHLKQYLNGSREECLSADATMVDWNAMPIRSPDGERGKGSFDGLSTVEFSVLGCIDHHVDEDFLLSRESIPSGQPLLVRPAGSCMSLVVSMLQSMGLWRDNTRDPISKEDGEGIKVVSTEEAQVAKLAFAPILIDTANLTARDKVTEYDTNAVRFLMPKVHMQIPSWDQNQYYERVLDAKQNSLDLLTVDEILGRDYKQWTETARDKSIDIGFCSMVKSVPWIVRKAGSPSEFLDSLNAFAERRGLGIVVVMTAFNSNGRFCRELLALALANGLAVDALESFVSQASTKLGLEEWTSLDETNDEDQTQAIKSVLNNDVPTWKRIWIQTDVTKSRKQVAPLVREAVTTR